MNPDSILSTFNRHGVQYMLIGGMNYLLRHGPPITHDIDLWIEDSDENRAKAESALAELKAEWGATDADWKGVDQLPPGWLERRGMFSMNSPHGAIDVFRSVFGLGDFASVRQNAIPERTAHGTPYWGIADDDMLKCQLALDPGEQRQDRIRSLKDKINKP